MQEGVIGRLPEIPGDGIFQRGVVDPEGVAFGIGDDVLNAAGGPNLGTLPVQSGDDVNFNSHGVIPIRLFKIAGM